MATKTKPYIPEFFPKIKAGLLWYECNFVSNEITLHLADGHCTDFTGAIAFGKSLNPDVDRIHIRAKGRTDYSYQKQWNGTWQSDT